MFNEIGKWLKSVYEGNNLENKKDAELKNFVLYCYLKCLYATGKDNELISYAEKHDTEVRVDPYTKKIRKVVNQARTRCQKNK